MLLLTTHHGGSGQVSENAFFYFYLGDSCSGGSNDSA